MLYKAKEKGRKDMEKARKILEPLSKKLAEDPDFMSKLSLEVDDLNAQIAHFSISDP
jgi:hypothetical protein